MYTLPVPVIQYPTARRRKINEGAVIRQFHDTDGLSEEVGISL